MHAYIHTYIHTYIRIERERDMAERVLCERSGGKDREGMRGRARGERLSQERPKGGSCVRAEMRGRYCICEGDTASARGYCICEGDTVSEVKQEREVLSAGIRGMRRKETVRSDRLVSEKDE